MCEVIFESTAIKHKCCMHMYCTYKMHTSVIHTSIKLPLDTIMIKTWHHYYFSYSDSLRWCNMKSVTYDIVHIIYVYNYALQYLILFQCYPWHLMYNWNNWCFNIIQASDRCHFFNFFWTMMQNKLKNLYTINHK